MIIDITGLDCVIRLFDAASAVTSANTVGSPPAIVNAGVDPLAPLGVRHPDNPLTPSRVWDAMRGHATPPI